MSINDTSGNPLASTLDPIAATLKNPFSTTVKNNGQRPVDFPNGFQIVEYVNGSAQNGLAGVPDTTIRLVGNLMPFQPLPWSVEQRLVKEYYAGNPEAVVQVLGPKHGPLMLKGRLKDKRYQDPAWYGVSYQYNLALKAMIQRGNLVKVGLHGSAGDFFRWGFLERGEFKMNKLSWIDYEIEIFVVSETQPINNYFSAPERQAPSAVNQNLINQAATFQQNYSSCPSSMPLSIAGLINNLTSLVATNVNLVTNFVGTIISTAQSIDSSAQRALGLIKNAQANISMFRRQIDNIAHDFSSLSSQGSPAGQTRDTYSNLQFIFESTRASAQLSAYLDTMQAQFEAIALTVPKARYRVQNGDTLQNISIKFYGISDHWTDIYDHNQLSSTDLVNGTWTNKPILEIPNV